MTHPLARLRATAGLSHPDYARLVAQTHSKLGYGHMAARREKVSRWESGRTVPEHTAQLAIAHIHGIEPREVYRLGWPAWLRIATGDADWLETPYTHEGAVETVHNALGLPEAHATPTLVVGGPALARQLRAVRARLARPQPWPARDGPGLPDDYLDWAEARTEALEQHESGTLVPPAALYGSAHAEFRMIVHLLTRTGYDHPTGQRLLRLATRISLTCAWLSSALGEETRAERHNLTALRTAAAAADPEYVSATMDQLSMRHLLVGDPADALALLRAARATYPRPSPHTSASLYVKEALAHARLGMTDAFARSLDLAAEARTAPGENEEAGSPFDIDVDDHHLAGAGAAAWVFLGRPHRARGYFDALTNSLAEPRPTPPSPLTARRLLSGVDAYLALNEIDLACWTVHRAIALTGHLSPGLTTAYRDRLNPYQHEPLVRAALDHLSDDAPGRFPV
ncbi:hypothetical protein ACIPYS_20860 [Kitasatospora sp. NPDC089913]|uniref:hypothetical protein n=1 Tax=Kitasatospora sp. NPDC089913 TaxID=3364080 RepID=UPI003818EBEF